MKFEVVEVNKKSLDYDVLSTHLSSHAASSALCQEQKTGGKRLLAVLKRPEPPAMVPVEVMLDLWDEFCGGTGYYSRGFLVSSDPALPFAFRYRDDHPICGTMLRGGRTLDVHFLTLGLRSWRRELRGLWQREFLDRAAVDPLVIQKINENVAAYLKKRPKKKRRISKKEANRLRRWYFAVHKPKKS